jgi:hypothetical protein
MLDEVVAKYPQQYFPGMVTLSKVMRGHPPAAW